jgi:hypothetical protein
VNFILIKQVPPAGRDVQLVESVVNDDGDPPARFTAEMFSVFVPVLIIANGCAPLVVATSWLSKVRLLALVAIAPDGADALTVMLKLNVVLPLALVALITYVATGVAAVGDPEMTPDVALSERPAGNAGLTV